MKNRSIIPDEAPPHLGSAPLVLTNNTDVIAEALCSVPGQSLGMDLDGQVIDGEGNPFYPAWNDLPQPEEREESTRHHLPIKGSFRLLPEQWPVSVRVDIANWMIRQWTEYRDAAEVSAKEN